MRQHAEHWHQGRCIHNFIYMQASEIRGAENPTLDDSLPRHSLHCRPSRFPLHHLCRRYSLTWRHVTHLAHLQHGMVRPSSWQVMKEGTDEIWWPKLDMKAGPIRGRKIMIWGCLSYLDSKEENLDLGQLIYSSATHSLATKPKLVMLWAPPSLRSGAIWSTTEPFIHGAKVVRKVRAAQPLKVVGSRFGVSWCIDS